ncbi:putative ATP/GTP binding protein [Yersinia frederiksenii]|uniref:ATP/GTP binding protein n=1 Tax=Yersinia intermedia TaxID=631 RepID=A0A208ZV73_YERIN|nr:MULTISPECIES: ParB family protein [Yersiniaceae]EKN4829732.1 ParB family protein [Yersinia enterocolitica]EKN4850973.1 ParB family protein [Yersinia enterocolitica]ELI8278147.1 ParB family protein [Yersinia enterocolitica]ELW8177100.1 ParB family protein [Yersinia enterocolitica]MBB1580515.1 ParB family protein [Serratia sp. OS31]
MTSKKEQTLGEQLLQRGRSPASGTVAILPVSEMAMVLTLDQLRPNPDNPRTTRNPKYDDIKASILARGLDSVPKVTKDPDSADDVYIFSDGGNTRYTILVELWEETLDERFRRIQCIFKPWPGRLKCVIGHLAENDVRGDLLFIEKALGIAKAKCIYEEQIGKKISQRELELFLRTEGYPITQSNISRMEYTLENLYPYMPTLLNSGMGRIQVIQLISLRTAAQKAWSEFSVNIDVVKPFNEVFGGVCHTLDDPDHYTLETFKDELIAALLLAMPSPEITYDRWLIELDPKEQNRRKLFGEPAPLPQHIINADRGTETKGEGTIPVGTPVSSPDVPPNDDSHIKEEFPAVRREPDAVISLQDVKPSVPVDADPGKQRKEEEQPDLYGLPNASRESTLPVTFPLSTSADAVRQDQQKDDLSHVLESATLDSSVSFANTGLEPVTDIWHISALQDDIEHLQDAAFRLAFELAEVLEAEQELCEDNAMGSAGYRLQVSAHQASPITRLLAGLSGDAAVSLSALELTTIVIGAEQPADWPLLDDVQMVKFLRLIRVIRRLREIQRQLQPHQDGEE